MRRRQRAGSAQAHRRHDRGRARSRGDTARLLAPFDNILLGHADRERIISDADRARVFTVNGIVRGSVLVNGFVRGTWRHSVRRDEAIVDIEAFRRISTKDTKAVDREARRLLAMLAPNAKSHRVTVCHPNGS